ncbi:hypothetical protein CJF12_16595 [Chryseobacterium piperi]|uniref:hypothetical protein n=1 Tax=Chryseobacterium piperi TaxID=558152 RepID=UPI00068972D2|nr:hypothetical protein [Chryseobacterium piperi]ASW75737.1 hypothetical protein CJF12_16595 [Chryseobacterium piperi]
MKIWTLSIMLLLFVACKKESTSSKNSSTDSISQIGSTSKDTLKSQQGKRSLFTFATELCDNKGYFDESKYTRQEIEGTYKLYHELSGLLLDSPHVFNLEDLYKVRNDKDQILEKLNQEFSEKKKLIENLKVVNTPYWQNVKKQKYQELLNSYEKQRIQILAYSDPSVLLNSKISKNCIRFVNALNSDDRQMVEEWKKLRIEMSKRNGNPQNVIEEFEKHLNSPDKKDYAIIDLIVFGWGNCANDDIDRPQYDEKMNAEFNSLFIKIDSDCDGP